MRRGGGTWVQEMWNHVLQELQEMEGMEQPTCREQPPQGLFLVGFGRSLYIDLEIFGPSLYWFGNNTHQRSTLILLQVAWVWNYLSLAKNDLQLCIAKSSFLCDEILCECQFEHICLWAGNFKALTLLFKIKLMYACMQNSSVRGFESSTLYWMQVDQEPLKASHSASGT